MNQDLSHFECLNQLNPTRILFYQNGLVQTAMKYGKNRVNLDFSLVADKQNLFTSAPYISTYQSIKEEDTF